ncbi:MAG: aminoglycoside phosphotransferase [Alphaproteobacteria bacterium HGW-Alphaproteobacteria-1]|jgi:thiamine kinase-like enzyme|nr:MAG: aminoglycoside phosphotransferase [Alphaproteobacteria bacterium HGW-Alphaproteobacteria-1]
MTVRAGDRRGALLPALGQALDAGGIARGVPELMADTGLAHDHVRLGGTGRIARLPKQSQMQLAPAENLAYQAACFERASASGHAPRLHAVLPPSETLPRGGLIVDEIEGRPARLPEDLPAIMDALAAIHALPVPEARAPLLDPADPLADLLAEIEGQAQHLHAAHPATQAMLETHITALRDQAGNALRPPKRLISFDAHPGNFIVTPEGRAVLVDLEKARYSAPPLDLAHATLYTSTTWDVASHAVLSPEEVAGACRHWLSRLPKAERAALAPWILPMRRAMWLWSMTWCAKWRVLSGAEAKATQDGEDWAAAKSEAALIAHVRGRVDHYLDPETAERLDSEFGLLADTL